MRFLFLLLTLGASPARAAAVDMSNLVLRLEDMTMDTTQLRALLARVSVSFRPPTASANAQYSGMSDHLYLPDTLQEPGRAAIRYDLDSAQLSTVIHELTHASADLLTSDAPGTPGGEHARALALLASRIRDGAVLARYPRYKADEVAGYYMGCAIGDVADTYKFLEIYNTGLAGAMTPDPEQARRMGGTVLLFSQRPSGSEGMQPPPATWVDSERRLLGACDVAGSAMLEGSLIGVEPDAGVKGLLFQNALGLKPPLSVRDLVKRLNDPAYASPGIVRLRAAIAAARLKRAGAAR